MTDLDGDGTVSPWEANICRMCLLGVLALTLGKEAIGFVA